MLIMEKILKGDKFKCLEDVEMKHTHQIAYKQDNIYISEKNDCVTDEFGDIDHYWEEGCEFEKYFIKINSKKHSSVNHPSHYNQGNIECIDAMVSAYGIESVIDFCICNAFKYLWRFKGKNGIEDIEKAEWYLNKLKELNNL